MTEAGWTHGAGKRRITYAILATYAFRLVAAWLLALPIVNVLGASGVSSFPEGDRKLFESGGLYLLEALQREQTTLAAQLVSASWQLLLFSFAGLGCEWLVLRALRRAPPREALSSEAAWVLPRLALLGTLTWLVRGVFLVTTLTLAMTVRSYFLGAEDERISDVSFLVVVALGLLAQLVVSVLRDVTSASLVEHDMGRRQACLHAFGVLKRGALSLFTRYAVVGLATLAVLASCAVAVAQLDVARAGLWRTGLSFAAHQAALLATIALRSHWLSQAVRAVED